MKTGISAAICCPLFYCGLLINSVLGEVMLSPVAVDTDIATYSSAQGISITNMIDHSGVVTPFTNGVTVFDDYFADPFHAYATPGSGGTNNWQSEVTYDCGTNQGQITFDLGAVYQITKLAIWNKSLSNVTVKVLADLGGPEQLVGDFGLDNYQFFFNEYGAQILPFGSSYEGRYIRLEVNSVYVASPGFSFGYSIIGEVVASVAGSGASTPDLSILSETNGDVTVTFAGTLLTSLTANGTFTNVPGNPNSPYTLARTNLLPQQFFRAQGN